MTARDFPNATDRPKKGQCKRRLDDGRHCGNDTPTYGKEDIYGDWVYSRGAFCWDCRKEVEAATGRIVL